MTPNQQTQTLPRIEDKWQDYVTIVLEGLPTTEVEYHSKTFYAGAVASMFLIMESMQTRNKEIFIHLQKDLEEFQEETMKKAFEMMILGGSK